jgi:hypothetical protein
MPIVNNPYNETQVATSITGTVGFYGTTPIAQRALAAQATSLVGTASSTALDTATKAALIESDEHPRRARTMEGRRVT